MNDENLALRLHQLVWLMDQKADQLLRSEYGLPLSWGRLLITLASSGPLSQHDLAQRLNHSDAAISRQLDRMSESGLLIVKTDPAHRRRRLVGLTTAGRSKVVQASEALESLLRDDMANANLDSDEFARSVAALARQLSQRSSL